MAALRPPQPSSPTSRMVWEMTRPITHILKGPPLSPLPPKRSRTALPSRLPLRAIQIKKPRKPSGPVSPTARNKSTVTTAQALQMVRDMTTPLSPLLPGGPLTELPKLSQMRPRSKPRPSRRAPSDSDSTKDVFKQPPAVKSPLSPKKRPSPSISPDKKLVTPLRSALPQLSSKPLSQITKSKRDTKVKEPAKEPMRKVAAKDRKEKADKRKVKEDSRRAPELPRKDLLRSVPKKEVSATPKKEANATLKKEASATMKKESSVTMKKEANLTMRKEASAALKKEASATLKRELGASGKKEDVNMRDIPSDSAKKRDTVRTREESKSSRFAIPRSAQREPKESTESSNVGSKRAPALISERPKKKSRVEESGSRDRKSERERASERDSERGSERRDSERRSSRVSTGSARDRDGYRARDGYREERERDRERTRERDRERVRDRDRDRDRLERERERRDRRERDREGGDRERRDREGGGREKEHESERSRAGRERGDRVRDREWDKDRERNRGKERRARDSERNSERERGSRSGIRSQPVSGRGSHSDGHSGEKGAKGNGTKSSSASPVVKGTTASSSKGGEQLGASQSPSCQVACVDKQDLKSLGDRFTASKNKCTKLYDSGDYDAFEVEVRRTFSLCFDWALARETTELRRSEKEIRSMTSSERTKLKAPIAEHYRWMTKFAERKIKELEELKRKDTVYFFKRCMQKVYMRMFSLQRVWERDQRSVEAEARRVLGDAIAARQNGGGKRTADEEISTVQLQNVHRIVEDYSNVLNIVESVINDLGGGHEDAGRECFVQ